MLLIQQVILNQKGEWFVEIYWLYNLWKLFMYSKTPERGVREEFKTSHWQWSQWKGGVCSTCQHQTQEYDIPLWLPCKIMYKRDKVILEDKRHKQQDGKWDKFRSLPFLWWCLLFAHFQVEIFNHSSPWCEIARTDALDISWDVALQLRDGDWTCYPFSLLSHFF